MEIYETICGKLDKNKPVETKIKHLRALENAFVRRFNRKIKRKYKALEEASTTAIELVADLKVANKDVPTRTAHSKYKEATAKAKYKILWKIKLTYEQILSSECVKEFYDELFAAYCSKKEAYIAASGETVEYTERFNPYETFKDTISSTVTAINTILGGNDNA